MDLNGKRVLVVGLGKSGIASALFLKQRGAQVTVSDSKPQDQLGKEIPLLLDQGITVETGGHGERTFRGQDLIVVSPGVPVDSAPLAQARALGETVIGEIELAARFLPASLIAITGSNGKTTTTTLTGEIIATGGFSVVVGGNIGTPAISLVERTTPQTVIVLEVSSLTSLPIIWTGTGPSKATRMRKRGFSKTSRQVILWCSMQMIRSVWKWQDVRRRKCFGSAETKKCHKVLGWTMAGLRSWRETGGSRLWRSRKFPSKARTTWKTSWLRPVLELLPAAGQSGSGGQFVGSRRWSIGWSMWPR
jgi:Mur ligase middle domain